MKCPYCLAALTVSDTCRMFTRDGEESDIVFRCLHCGERGIYFEDAILEEAR